jgi:hypothetical protein
MRIRGGARGGQGGLGIGVFPNWNFRDHLFEGKDPKLATRGQDVGDCFAVG